VASTFNTGQVASSAFYPFNETFAFNSRRSTVQSSFLSQHRQGFAPLLTADSYIGFAAPFCS
jgi:hypothetical protein